MKKYVLIFFVILMNTSCFRDKTYDSCVMDLGAQWSYKLGYLFDLKLSSGEISFQNNDIGKITILNKKTGKVNYEFNYCRSEEFKGNVIPYIMDEKTLIYEYVYDKNTSYLKFINYHKNQQIDSLPIKLEQDLTGTKGSVKLSNAPAIFKDSLAIFNLDDGRLRCYNFLTRKYKWTIKLSKLLLTAPILTSNSNVYVILPGSGILGDQSNITNINILDGTILWKRSFNIENLKVFVNGNDLQTVDSSGDLITIDNKTGNANKQALINFKPVFFKMLRKKEWIASDRDNQVFVVDAVSRNVTDQFKIDKPIADAKLSNSGSNIFISEEDNHLVKFDLKTKTIKCIGEFVDNNFEMNGDNLYLFSKSNLELVKVK